MPRLLLTNNHLADFGGSEMVTLEIAEEFAARGWNVDIFTNHLAEPFSPEFDAVVSGGRARLSDEEPPRGLDGYDLLWVHHGVLPAAIIEALHSQGSRPPVVWHHMSSMPGLEAPVLADIENSAAAAISTISAEAQEALLEYGLSDERLSMLPNPAPRAFTEAPLPGTTGGPLRRIAIVSNHPPEELTVATTALLRQGIEVVRIGGDQPSRVTPESFEGLDAIVTIGKSVQYALCLGVPAYIYDHFGGEGWLSRENFEAERSSNFSGRSTRRRLSGEEIAAEIVSGFEDARSFAEENVEEHRALFSLRAHIDGLLERIEHVPNARAPIPLSHAKRWGAFAQQQRDSTRAVHGAWRALSNLQRSNAELEERNEALRQSRSFRLGNALLRPLRFLKR